MLPLLARADENAARWQALLADGWRFYRGPAVDAARRGFDDSAWQPVSIPHTWNAQDGQDGGGDYFRGEGWYRRQLRLDPAWTGKRIFLQFDGANRTATVFLNGARIGEHRGGTARFRFDVTPYVQFGADNVLAVQVSNEPHDSIPPTSADFTFCGGLYRSVSVIATDLVHVDLLDYASPGIYARPIDVSTAQAKLDVEVRLANDSGSAQSVSTKITLYDAAGQARETATLPGEIAAYGRCRLLRRLVIAQPRLWDGRADPYLYRLRVEVTAGDGQRDVVTLPVGLRSFSVDPEHGFRLNGHYLDLHGVNRHQERWDRGWALTELDEREDFGLIAEIGATAIRESHYQQSQLWQSLADESGMIVWAELGFVNDVQDSPEFFANAKEQLRELIRQNYHHPSICFWSIGNETFVRDPKTTAPDANDRLLSELAAVVREEDDTRLSTYASNGDATEARAAISDVIGYNHYFGWYRGKLDDFGQWLDTQHAARPDLRIGMSEFGAGANPSQHEEPVRQPLANGPWHPEEWQAAYHENYWQTLAARPWVWGKFVWCMFDFASDGRDEGGTPGRNDKGLVTADRAVRKDAFYWYKANWSGEPVLYITSRRFTPRASTSTAVKVYSNARSVELFVNGKSMGQVASDNRIFRWPDVRLRMGENAVRVVATIAGREVVDQCLWRVDPQSTVHRTEATTPTAMKVLPDDDPSARRRLE